MNAYQRLRDKMASASIEAMLVTDNTNLTWLTGFTGSSGLAVVTQDGGVFVTDSRYTVQAESEVKGLPVETFGSPKILPDFTLEQLQSLGVKRLGFESQVVTVAQREDWESRWTGVELVATKDLVSPLRMLKTDEELALIRQACGIADACFDHVQRLFQPGVSERDIELEIELFMRRQGATTAFEVIVASGWRSALPHGRASEKKLEAGDFVTLDFGACYKGLNSDVTRTVVLGEPNDRQREVYNQVLKAETECIAMMKPGVSGKAVDAHARMILDEKGLAQYFGHGLGHGLGRQVHDPGGLSSRSTDILEEGMVFTVEPGVYIAGWGGVRIEDDVLVTADGVEVLTHAPKELLVF
jgi:Xaa-Pro aminopeptidase